MPANAAAQWVELGYRVAGLGCLPILGAAAYLTLARQWVRRWGRRGTATIISAARVASLPHVITEVALHVQPHGEPEYVRVRLYARWSANLIDIAALVPGARLPVRYLLARNPIVMPDARAH